MFVWKHSRALKSFSFACVFVVAALAFSPFAGADVSPKEEIQILKDMVLELQRKVEALESKISAQTKEQPSRAAGVEESIREPASNAAAGKPLPDVDGPLRHVDSGAWKIPGTETSMSIGGYAKLDTIVDLDGKSGAQTNYLTIPLDSDPRSDERAAQVHARESRFFLKTWTPTDLGELGTHIEVDFFGTTGVRLLENSHGVRLRHAYGHFGPWLAGQTWSVFMDPYAIPETIDFSHAPGQTFIRQPQIRYTHAFGRQISGAIGLENPRADGKIVRAGVAADTAFTSVFDPLPDLTTYLQYELPRGHIRVNGVTRFMSVNDGAAVDDHIFGWGTSVTGRINTIGDDDFRFQIGYGDGIGRYIAEAARSAYSCSTAGICESQVAWGGFAGYRHWWTPSLRSNLNYGYAQIDWDLSQLGDGPASPLNEAIHSIHANVVWEALKNLDLGLEFSHSNRQTVGSGSGDINRIQLGVKYSF